MIAISSFKPHTENGEYRINQILALQSWVPHFKSIYYLGEKEEELSHKKVHFIPSEQFPTLKAIILHASRIYDGYTAIINADIVLSHAFSSIMPLIEAKNADAAVSRRYNFDLSEGTKGGKLTDYGLDVFIAKQAVWRKALQEVPDCLRLGHIQWDSWLVGFMNDQLKQRFVDFTNYRLVFHPNHQGRSAPYNSKIVLNDKYIHKASMPSRKL